MKILSLESVKNSNKTAIKFDDGYSFTCSNDLVLKHKLHRGKELSSTELKTMENEQRIFDLKQAAMNFASYKPRTGKQVKEKLKKLGFGDSESEAGIKFLSSYNLLDDTKYAITYAKEYLQRKPSGKIKLLQELKNKGISYSLAEEAVTKAFADQDEFELAMRAAKKKLKTIAHNSPDKQKRLLEAHLDRQGFTWDVIKKIVRENFSS
jgi:regulatory protein